MAKDTTSPESEKGVMPPDVEEELKKRDLDELLSIINEANYYALLTPEEKDEEEKRLNDQLQMINELQAKGGRSKEEIEKELRGMEKELEILGKAQDEAETKRVEAVKKRTRRPIEPYWAKQMIRHAEEEEKKKLTTDNSDELVSFFESALEDGDEIKCAAIFKKLCSDANENEILNYYGFPSTFEGMRMFGEKILIGKLGMGEQRMMGFMSDASYLNESRKHWDTARIVGVKDGRYYWLEPQDHVAAALAEIRKMQPREVARGFNRLGYGGETPNQAFNPGAGRRFEIGPLGIGILLAMADGMTGYIGGEKSEMPSNTVGHLYSQLDVIRRAGVSEKFCKRVEDEVKSGRTKEKLGDVVNTAMSFWAKEKGHRYDPKTGEFVRAGGRSKEEEAKIIEMAKKAVEKTKHITPAGTPEDLD
jgi:hypothetical protein